MSAASPRVEFVVGGMQKGGTTALARFLGQHPGVRLPRDKEAHVFDAPDFDEGWTAEQVDEHYRAHFDSAPGDFLFGDATPIYALHPALVRRIAAYNPAMRWILILRHPAERALSHYHMERARGNETWPLWPALLLESWRLRGHRDDFSEDSPLRRHSYRARGDYARQLDAIHAHFPPDQVLVLLNDALAQRPAETVARAWRFLGLQPVDGAMMQAFGRVFEGAYPRRPPQALRRGIWAWLFRRELNALEKRYGIRW